MGCCVAISRVITLDDAIRFASIALYVGETDITKECQFSWSQDRINWSCWNSYENYQKVCVCLNTDFYIRILVRNNNVPTIYINKVLTSCYSVALYDGNPFLEDPCQITSLSGFDIYSGWDCALMMQQQLSDQVICTLGIPVYYFRVVPDEDTKSYTFKEYVLHNVQSVKQIKMMIQDGTMPSSKPTLSEWDFEFETDWETELSKTQFATAFGTEAFPKQRDFVWVPMQKRMYMVNSAYEEKNENLMWRATTWKLALIKWQDQSNISDSNVENILDELIANKYSDVFEVGERREGELTAEPQLPVTYAANNLYSLEDKDYIRKQATIDTMKIVDRQINHGNLVVAKNKYIFYDVKVGDTSKPAFVSYQKGWCGNNGTLSMIFDYSKESAEDRTILSIGDFNISLKEGSITLPDGITTQPLLPGHTYLMIMRWGRSSNDINFDIYRLVPPQGVPSYKRKPNMYRFDLTHEQEKEIIPEEKKQYRLRPHTTTLDPRLICTKPVQVVLYGYPLQVANLKLYNKYIADEELMEVLKYTTKDEYCIINDQARPLNDQLGFSVR